MYIGTFLYIVAINTLSNLVDASVVNEMEADLHVWRFKNSTESPEADASTPQAVC